MESDATFASDYLLDLKTFFALFKDYFDYDVLIARFDSEGREQSAFKYFKHIC